MRDFSSGNDHNLTFSSLILCVWYWAVWFGSFFAVIWFLTSLSVVFLPLWKEGCSAGWKHHRMSSRDFTFHHGRLLIFISKRRQDSRGWSSPSLTLLSCFWGYIASLLYYVKVWGHEREQQVIRRKQSNVLGIHLLTGCPAASRRRVCWPGSIAHSRQLSGLEKKTSTVAKKSWNGDVSCRKKSTPVLPALKSNPSFNKEITFCPFLAACVCRWVWVTGALPLLTQVQEPNPQKRWKLTSCVHDVALWKVFGRDTGWLFSCALGNRVCCHEGAAGERHLQRRSVLAVWFIFYGRVMRATLGLHFIFCSIVTSKTADIDAEKCGPIFSASLSQYRFPALTPSSSLCLTQGY